MPDDQLGRSGRWGLRDMAIVVAGFAACLLLVIAASQTLIVRFLPEFPPLHKFRDPHLLANIGFSLVGMLGPTILVIWLIQAIGGRWRPRPDPIDRAGRVLGACWILLDLTSDYFRTHS